MCMAFWGNDKVSWCTLFAKSFGSQFFPLCLCFKRCWFLQGLIVCFYNLFAVLLKATCAKKNPEEPWVTIFFSGFNFTTAYMYVYMVYNCDDQSCLHIFLCSSHIWSLIYSLALFIIYGYITIYPYIYRYRSGHGFESRSCLNYFHNFHNCLSCVTQVW